MNKPRYAQVSSELNITPTQVEATATLLDEGATVPFIARYRKEVTGSLDEVAITAIRDRLLQLEELENRREAILKSLDGTQSPDGRVAGKDRRRGNPVRSGRYLSALPARSAAPGRPSPEKRGWNPWPVRIFAQEAMDRDGRGRGLYRCRKRGRIG